MIYPVFFRAVLVSCCFFSSFFLECPFSPKPRDASPVEVDGSALAMRQAVEERRKLGSEGGDDSASPGDDYMSGHSNPPPGWKPQRRLGIYIASEAASSGVSTASDAGALWVDIGVDKPAREHRLDSDSTVASGCGGGSALSFARHLETSGSFGSDGKDADDDVVGGAPKAKALAGDGAAVCGDSASGGSLQCSAQRTEAMCLEGCGEGVFAVVDHFGRESAKGAGGDGGKEAEDAVVVSSAGAGRRLEIAGVGVGAGCAAGAGCGTSAGRRVGGVSIDPSCKELSCEGFVDLYRAGEEKGREIYLRLAFDAAALFKCICDCDRKCGNFFYFDPVVYELPEERRALKLAKFWRSVQRVVIASHENPLVTGSQHGVLRFNNIATQGNEQFVRFVKQCEFRLSECSNPCFASTNKANLLYWAGCKIMFTTAFFENRPVLEIDYFKLGKNDGFLPVYVPIAVDLMRLCKAPIIHFTGKVHSMSVAMFNYWSGFLAGLQEFAELAVSES